MSKMTLALLNQNNEIQKSRTAEETVYLDYLADYQAGDKLRLTIEVPNAYYMVQLDETLNPSLLYLTGTTWDYEIPTSEEAVRAYSPKAFIGKKHYSTARVATEAEITAYQNLALNPHDQKQESGAYPHAVANVETRNDSTFFARNAIDGVMANQNHGSYPYQSWGINQQADALIRIDFGRNVKIDQVALVLRGDYPHDSYWTEVKLEFSDNSNETLNLDKVLDHQFFNFNPRIIQWVELKELKKAEDESPFPALTQIKVFGING
ncbi:hypothetical protein ACWOFR_13360 [Carnobacterium gallinarum]|uniref:hypothetical protein n=1 Tax=Carnobacterium gallinarum TaxID=2749 RepID=UPI000558F325|nr:hypothetical protein [Carnobacterium gallinarum]